MRTIDHLLAERSQARSPIGGPLGHIDTIEGDIPRYLPDQQHPIRRVRLPWRKLMTEIMGKPLPLIRRASEPSPPVEPIECQTRPPPPGLQKAAFNDQRMLAVGPQALE